MFTISDDHGTCPYDGFYIYAYKFPRADFIQRYLTKTGQGRRRSLSFGQIRYTMAQRQPKRQATWRHSVSMTIAGQKNALKVSWDPVDPWDNMPLTRIYFNPSTTNYDAQQTYELLLTVLDDPLMAVMRSIDTKVDVMAPFWEVAAHCYYPYARYKDHADYLPALGTIYEGKDTKLTFYAKAGDHDEQDRWQREYMDEAPVPPTTRVEMRQRFDKPRPTVEDFLRGAVVARNNLQYLRVVEDLDKLGDRLLAEEALQVGGLTRALREYREFANVSDDDIKAMKEHINAISTREIYDHYQVQAAAWHQTFLG